MIKKLEGILCLARRSAAHYQRNILNMLVKMIWLRLSERRMLYEIDLMGLLDSDPGYFKNAQGLSSRKLQEFQDILNPVHLGDRVNGKIKFHQRCSSAGLAVPEIYATGFPDIGIIESLPSRFLVKPEFGAGGFGISAFLREGSRYRSWNDKHFEGHELVEYLAGTTKSRKLIYQEWIQAHPDLKSISGKALLTIRAVTLLKEDTAEFISSCIRIPTANAIVDNMKVGLDGEGMLELNPESGESMYFWHRHESGFGIVRSDEVGQEIKVPVRSIVVPYWKEAKEMALELARLYPEMRFLGWDIGISEKGPVAIEGNTHWGYPIYPSGIEAVKIAMT